MSKKKIRWTIDLIMTIIFILVMGYHQTGVETHEYLGLILFVLFIIHNLLNIQWYKILQKGKLSKQRLIFIIINFLLIISVIGSMISGMMMSNYVFAFLNLNAGMFARKLHMISTAWCFMLMSLHLGLHWSMFYQVFKNKIKGKSVYEFLDIFLPILAYTLVLCGLWVFIQRELWNEMFLLVDYIFLDFQEPFILFVLKQICLMSMFVWIAYMIKKIIRGETYEKNI